METLKTCKYCGREGLIWRRTGTNPRTGDPLWALYEPDAQGRAKVNHSDECYKSRLARAAGPAGTAAAGVTGDAAEVQRIIDENASEIGEFIESASTTLEAEREAVADAADAPVIARYTGGTFTPASASTIPVPAGDPTHLVDAAHLATLKRILAVAIETDRPQNIGMHGPAGSGKTTLAVQIGALYAKMCPGRGSVVVIDSSDKETANDWFGTATLQNGTVTFVESDFVRAVETEGAVIVLDDVALLQSATVSSGLNALLDPSRRAIYIQQLGRVVQVAPGVVFVGTWNVGSEYTSASPLSLQILDRFRAGALFEVPYPDATVLTHIIRSKSGCPKAAAQRLADAAGWLRSDPEPIFASTRGLVAAGVLIRKGATIGGALFFTTFGELTDEDRQRAYTIIWNEARRSGYPETEQKLWEAPQQGTFVPFPV